jgi:predicted permease
VSEKKSHGRSFLTLAIICIILAVGVIGAIAYERIVVSDKNATNNGYTSSQTYPNSGYDNSYYSEYYRYIHTDMPPADYKEP